ncbi:MAG TPA: acyltransferase [Terracidiphilus sp.]
MDGLRALAVTVVFVEHFGGGSHGGPFLAWFNRAREIGSYGVSLFFVLSGFLITGILYDTLGSGHYFKNFYARRSLRIFPIFYLVMAVCLILTPVLHFRLQWAHISFLFYLGNLFANWNWSLYELISPTHPAWSINLAHLWSLFVEEQFYLIWPVVIYLVRDRIKLIKLSLFVIMMVLLVRIGMACLVPMQAAEQFAYRMLPTRADDLLVGAAMALLLRGPKAEKWLRSASFFLLFGLYPFVLLAFPRENFRFVAPYNLTIGLTFISLASAGLIGLCIQRGTAVFRILSLPPLRLIGKYSYGFYIYHILFDKGRGVYLAWCMTSFHSMAIGGLVYAFTSYLGVLVVAGLSYELFEKRFLAMKSRFPSEVRPAAPQNVPTVNEDETVANGKLALE